MKKIKDLLEEHQFFKGLAPEFIELIAGCGSNVLFQKGEYLAQEGKAANLFFIIREGKVSIDTRSPERGPIIIQTVHAGEILGWSWIIEPHIWRFNACALEPTHAVALDGACLRKKCEKDSKLGYELLKRFSRVLAQRLEMTRLQLLDIYGAKTS